MTMHRARWNHGPSLRLPKSVALAAQIDDGDTVDIVVEQGVIVIRRARTRYSLKKLVGGITGTNRHDEIDWGAPVGREG